MKSSLSWIKDYVPDLDVTAREYADAMTLSGTKVEEFEELDDGLDKVVVGKVLSVEKHPDADKLVVCMVDVGEAEPIQIVTGAPNVVSDVMVPVVLDGGSVAGGHDGSKRVPGGIKIKAGKLRGVQSDGMICAIEELGSSRDVFPDAPEYGIYIFPEEADIKPGDDAIEALGLHDTVVEYEITSNRVDCYSIIGIAREAAATFDKKFNLPAVNPTGNDENAADYISVEVQDEKLCRRFVARVVKDVKVAPSPDWMKKRLRSMGIRPINNLVDITNFVMLEYGQPMHAYDLEHIAGRKIVVKTANDGDEFVTLDGQVRPLFDDSLMICDGEKPVGLAGIMGGENSMITDDVKDMLLEAACFDGTNVRQTSHKVGLRTDASTMFEKGLDPQNAKAAMERACSLIEEFGAGTVVGGEVDVYPEPVEFKLIKFEPDEINTMLGLDLSADEMLDIFRKLDLLYNSSTNEVMIPSFRQDLNETADLAEEVARFYGYDKIPTTLPTGQSMMGGLPFDIMVSDTLKDAAVSCGYSQGYMYSFESPKAFDLLGIPEDSDLRKTVVISNPLGEDYSVMRTQTVNGMLTSLATNFNRRIPKAKLFETGNIYLPHQVPITELPDEKMMLTLGSYQAGDFYNLKGDVECILRQIGMKDEFEYVPDEEVSYMHPGKCAHILYHKKEIGLLGEVHPTVCERYGIGKRTYLAVIDLSVVTGMAKFEPKFKPLAKFPATLRDLSLVVPEDVMAGDIAFTIRKAAGRTLESCELFDLYQGDQIEAGYKSMAYTLTFRAPDRTLKDEEVGASIDKVLKKLEAKGIKLR
ncbi:MAG: phenylalanine--tRNA ligase subunit beta, partial [Lachnospiraceae bacterium]|nr:phenylalanine--tRNA ligase subunit beta [Lachnospiraceae bacterium]